MLIITNRNINHANFKDGVGDHQAFGDKINAKGPNEVRLAHAVKVDDQWQVRLVAEPSKLTLDNIPSKHVFNSMRRDLATSNKNCVFFIHGFNQSFSKNLEKSLAIEQAYNVEVIAFSWPSNPGGFMTSEYRQAKRNAQASVGALDATLEKIGVYLKTPFNKPALETCETKLSLMAYSQGNFLLQNYINNAQYEDETHIFDNIILCQADVDNHNHALWVEQIQSGKHVYITINENDYVLKWSDANFQKDRLGRTARNLNADNATYFDFTDGADIGNTHGIFYKNKKGTFNRATNNPTKNFFDAVLNGNKGQNVDGFVFDDRVNVYRC
ncbi:alpha/beta hydrolase [Vibrio gallicus]|uniref:alpha/beta hydrolase n=1 Tax=Vibrio gallicus TaxID=190897 RepID=UPI0021C46F6A|nr:alpha/beta hydrolase [Vibrio gallicus]